MIQLPSITKTYGERRVLSMPALNLEPGKSYALVGANGSGKSTFLRILAGVLAPDAPMKPLFTEGQMAYLPQHPYGFQMSVLKNVQLALPEDRKKEEAPALEALKKVGMESFAQSLGSRLSGGETQRMAFARVLVMPHKVLLLDEPTSAADIAGNDRIEKALMDYRKETGCTVVMSTHSLAQAARLCDVMLFMHKGDLTEMGPTAQLLDAPKSEPLKEFLAHWRV